MSSLGIYRVIAKAYDLLDVTYFRDYDKSPRKAVLERIGDNDAVLDLCCGTATNSINIAKTKHTVKVTGIDLSDKMLDIGKTKVKKEHLSNVTLKQMDATALELPDGAFDEVLISLVLHELDETLSSKLILEAKRVLKDGGRIVVTEWEKQEKKARRILFAPIALLEPKPYKSFIRKDMNSFFAAFGLNVDEYIHCDYSRVLVLSKAGQEKLSNGDIRYLEQTKMLDYSDESIQELIRERGWLEYPVYERIGMIYNYVRDEVLFGYNHDDSLPASRVLRDGYGQCNTKGTLFMALLRACDVPCRVHAFTITKRLQHGAMTGYLYRNAPDNVFHSWVEVYYEGKWYNLEGLILDKKYLHALQSKFFACEGSFCEYGVGVENFREPVIDWNGNDTYIQSLGINQDFGVYDNPDDMLLEHHQEIGPVRVFMFRYLGRHLMNRNVRKIRG